MAFLLLFQTFHCINPYFFQNLITNFHFNHQNFWNSDDFFSRWLQMVQFFLLLCNFPPHHFLFLISLFLRNSSLHKQPFITAHFQSSLHILCITVRWNKPCLSPVSSFIVKTRTGDVIYSCWLLLLQMMPQDFKSPETYAISSSMSPQNLKWNSLNLSQIGICFVQMCQFLYRRRTVHALLKQRGTTGGKRKATSRQNMLIRRYVFVL